MIWPILACSIFSKISLIEQLAHLMVIIQTYFLHWLWYQAY